MRAIVLGGGIAGLSAAWGLRRAGYITTLFEVSPSPGGLAGGFQDRGYTFDFFSHRLWTRDREVLRLCEAWSGRPLLRRRKISRILLDGRLYHYPLDLRDLLGPGGLSLAAASLAGYLQQQVGGRKLEPDDFQSFMTARYGAPLYERFFGPYTEKLTGVPGSELSSDLAREAIPPAGLLQQLVHRALGREEAWEELYYPEGGFMTIPEGLTTALRRGGAEVRLGHRVTALRGDASGIREVWAEGPSGAVRRPADIVVSTIPVAALLAALEGFDVDEARAAAPRLRTRAMVVVYLGVRRERLTADHWIYVPDPAVRFNRLSETVNYAPRMAPRGATGICAEIACERGDRVWTESDASQVRRVIDDLIGLGFLRGTGEVEAAWVRRFPAAYPIYTLAHREVWRSVETPLGRIANLRVCGRQGAFWYGSTAQGIRQGLDVASEAGSACDRSAPTEVEGGAPAPAARAA